MHKGIVSPFAEERPERAAPTPRRSWRDAHEDETAPEQRTTVRLVGVRYRLSVEVGGCPEPAEGLATAKRTLGAAVREVLALRAPAAEFVRQSLYEFPPARTHVAVPLGDFTVYSATTTFDPAAVEAQVVDRLAVALTASRRAYAQVEPIITKYRIKTVTT